ncbi:MAG: sigma-70 family RNA polymerase sigma factor [Planctomycetota bacterium]|jgi:RNA polymerase sigma-70 factor (ECF subfamily)
MKSNEELITEFFDQRRDSAYEEIVNRHAGFAYNVALGVLHDPGLADDAVQEAFLKLLRTGAAYQPTGSFRAWFGRVAFTAALDIRRKTERRVKHETAASVESTGKEGAMDRDGTSTATDLKALVKGLPWDLRTPVILKYFQKTPQKEIAEIMECTEGTVSKRIDKALGRLRGTLTTAGYAALVPGLEASLLGFEGEAVPAAVLETLASLSPSVAPATAAPVGAALLPKAGKFAAGLIVVLTAAVGVVLLLSKLRSDPELVHTGTDAAVAAEGREESGQDDGVPVQEPVAAPPVSGEAEGRGRPAAPGAGKPLPLLWGTVIAKEGGPVPNARVFLTRESPLNVGVDGVFSNMVTQRLASKAAVPDDPVAETSADGEGRFVFQPGDVKEGTYGLRASAPGFASSTIHAVKVAAGAGKSPYRLVLRAAATVSGRVVDDARWGVEGADVVALDRNYGTILDKERYAYTKFWTRTGKDGRFQLNDLLPNREYLVFSKKEGFANISFGKYVRSPAKGVVIELTKGFCLAGAVLDRETGGPVPNAKITASSSRPAGVRETKTDADGRYRLPGLPSGSYRVSVFASGFKEGTARVEGHAPGELERDFHLKRGVTVTGMVVDEATGRPLAGVRILALHGDEDAYTNVVGVRAGEKGVVTGEEGTFTLSGSIPVAHYEVAKMEGGGSYYRRAKNPAVLLGAFKRGWHQGDLKIVDPRGIDPSGEGVRIAMRENPVGTGRVVDPNGRPVAGAKITAVRVKEVTSIFVYQIFGESGFGTGMHLTRESFERRILGGKADAPRLSGEKGDFRIELFPGKGCHLAVTHDDFALGIEALPELSAGEKVGALEIRLTAGGSIEGEFQAKGGHKVSGMRLICRYMGEIEGAKRNPMAAVWGKGFRSCHTDARSEFAFRHLRPGVWEISGDSLPDPSAMRVTVTEGATAKVRYMEKR